VFLQVASDVRQLRFAPLQLCSPGGDQLADLRSGPGAAQLLQRGQHLVEPIPVGPELLHGVFRAHLWQSTLG
jgi:hypothetical protein